MDNKRLSPYYFVVELDGIETVSFTECSGLAAEMTVYEIEEGGYNTSTHKFIGHTKNPNVVLKNGISKISLLHEWCKSWFNQGDNDKVDRKTISVVLYNSARKEMFRWNLFRCFPCRWKVETLDVKDNSYAIEMLEIAYEDMAVDETEEMPVNPLHVGQDMSGGQFTDTMIPEQFTVFFFGFQDNRHTSTPISRTYYSTDRQVLQLHLDQLRRTARSEIAHEVPTVQLGRTLAWHYHNINRAEMRGVPLIIRSIHNINTASQRSDVSVPDVRMREGLNHFTIR